MTIKKTLTVLLLLSTGCSSSDGGTNPILQSNVFVNVHPGGDGDGTVGVVGFENWSCTWAAGTATDCSRDTYDAGNGGTITLTATPSAGSTFAGWSESCTGTESTCTVSWGAASGGGTFNVGATFLLTPTEVQVSVAAPALDPGMATTATASVEALRPLSGAQYDWASSDPSVATITGTGSEASVAALSVGTTQISATVRGVASTAVTVTVGGVIYGVLYDVDETTPVDSAFLSMGPVEGSTGVHANARTGVQEEGRPAVPAGGYRFRVPSGRYAVFTSGVVGKRWISTPGDTADVIAGDSTELKLSVTDGYHLDMTGTELSVQATAGTAVGLVVEYRAWNRDECPGCVPSLAIGVDGTALAVYRFGSPGIYPGKHEENVPIQITVPDHEGTFYATLVTTSTAADIEPGLQQYRDRWNAGLQASTLIPIGTLTLN